MEKATLTPVTVLPTKDGEGEILRQWTGPPIPWDMSLEDAVAAQRQRDNPEGPGRGETLKDMIKRKRWELRALEERLQKEEEEAERKKLAEAEAA